MKIYLISCLVSILLSTFLGKLYIKLSKKIKLGQTVLKYVESHKDKNGTPTMGGLFFIASAFISYSLFFGFTDKITNVAVCIGIAFLLVGFLDDFIKIRSNDNMGLKPYQKIIFQFSIALISGLFCYYNGIIFANIPFGDRSVNFGVFIIPLVIVVFIAITNSVNLTDGLDSLAGSTSLTYLIFMFLIIVLQNQISFFDAEYSSFNNLLGLICTLIGGVIGFLVFNVNKAKVFMGDTGSLSLGGFLGAISIFSSNVLLIPILGAVFVASSLSVIIQVFVFKTKGKRVFLMSPLHHHFQIKGYTESKISYCYCLVTGILGAFLIICYL